MKITVYRPNQIGGCITEIESSGGTRIIIDVGSNLPSVEGEWVDIKKLTEKCDGVFITHYHGDHIGEFENVDNTTPIYMGVVAHKIFLNLCAHLPD
ncbi:MAG: MBL fold metallo-hydrolase, partial [Oscillospiraceae bacterium]|nr:MBL fold metallo-hydrolase [Oscillospiraceae bacterium]